MNKIINDPTDAEDIAEWMFPEIDYSLDEEILKDKYQDGSNDAEVEEEDELIKEELLVKTTELENLKFEEKQKIEIINNIFRKLEESLSFLDKEFIEILQNIVRNATKNIILKEIDIDPDTISRMVNGLKELIHEKNGMINVFLSETDYKRLNKDEINDLTSIKIDSSLGCGDIIIKSSLAEIQALLNDRLDKMLGIKK